MSDPKQPDFKPVAIVGIGALFPKAGDLNAFWNNIMQGVDAVGDVPETHWRPEDYYDPDPKKPDHTYTNKGAFLSPYDFNPMEYGIPPRDLEATDTSQLLGMVVAANALKDAGYGPEREFDRERVSVIVGVTGTQELVIPLGARLGHPIWRNSLRAAGVDEPTAEKVIAEVQERYVPWTEASFPGLLGNVVAGRISKFLNTGGSNCVVDAACASALSAMHLAQMELATGRADMVLTGGVDTLNDIFMHMCFSKTPALSPTGNSRPFDAKGDGTILGEGIGVVALKRHEDALRDGDKVYAVITGMGSSSDGRGEAIYAPCTKGQAKAIRRAYAMAGDISPKTIELVEAHGTGTKVGDAVEARGLREVYGEAGPDGAWCALGSVKSMIGHTKAAAGAAGLIKAALALHHKVLPPTIKVEYPLAEVAPGAGPFYVNTKMRPWLSRSEHPRRAAVSSFGFGGSNFHFLMEEATPGKPETALWSGKFALFTLSGSEAEIKTALGGIDTGARWEELRMAAGRSREAFRADAPVRLIVLAEQDGNLGKQLENARKLLAGGAQFAAGPDGRIAVGRGAQAGELAVLFPGQGAQYVDMQVELACRFPEAHGMLESAETAIPGLAGIAYPHPAFDEATRAAQQARLTETQNAQPAIGTASLGAWRVLEKLGVKAASFAGHSYGELTALAAAGRLSEKEFLRFSRRRGELMAAGDGDRGTMAAVKAPLEQIEGLIAESGLAVVLANKNSPDQGVVSGATEMIENFEKFATDHGVTVKRLPVAAAFHSELVASAAEPFTGELAEAAMARGSAVVFANSTGKPYPDSADEVRTLLGSQLARPVEFVAMVREMVEAGARTFLEVGPGARLTGLVRAILADRDDVTAVAIDGSNGKKSGEGDLLAALGALAARGVAFDLAAVDPQPQPAPAGKKKGMIVPLSGANYLNPERRAKINENPPPVAPKPQESPRMQPKQPQPSAIQPQPQQPRPETPPPAQPQPQQMGAGHEALRMTQENMRALQAMQEQTAALHRQFLEGQTAMMQTLTALMHQQRSMMTGAPAPTLPQMPPVPAMPQFAAAPAPQPVQPQAQPQAQPAAQPRMTPAEAAKLWNTNPVQSTPRTTGEGTGPTKVDDSSSHQSPKTETVPVNANAASSIEATLLRVIAEKTGYPEEMLELEMGLDADLGIDSIKRVEILSALQEAMPELPHIQPDQLGSLNTLGQIVEHLAAAAPSVSSVPASASTPATTPAAATVGASQIEATLLRVIAEKTGYPEEMLELDMGLDADLGIDSIKRVEILSALQEAMPELPHIQPDQLGSLNTLGQIVEHLAAHVPTASASASPAAATTSGPNRQTIEGTLLRVIAEKTGYPEEMLELDMGLDADLGIDSIKRVEILSALQEAMPELPHIQPDQLGSLNTLGQIVDYLTVAAPVAAEPVAQPAPAPVATSPTRVAKADNELDYTSPTTLERHTLSIEQLDPSGQTALELPEGSLVWVSDDGELAPHVAAALEQHGLRAQVISPDAAAQEDPPADLVGVILLAPARTDDADLRGLFFMAQATAGRLRARGEHGTAFLTTVSRVDGTFGLATSDEAAQPVSGGLAGLAKTAHREWSEVHCKALDLAPGLEAVETAGRIVEQALTAGPLEVGLLPGALVELKLNAVAQSTPAGKPGIGPGDVVVVSGGARGVTAEIAVALAQACGCKLALLGRSPAPSEEPQWLAGLNDPAAIKRALHEQLRATTADGKVPPRELEEKFRATMTHRELLRTFERLEQIGVDAVYRSVDVRDEEGVSKAFASIRDQLGPVTGIAHGAGVLADKHIEEKTADQFDRVYGTKVEGLRALLAAAGETPLKLLALFSSSTARFGRVGQVDYAMANEVLNKMAQAEARRRPDCRVVSFNWGPWAGGMVTPALAKLFASEGIGLIELREGARFLVRELTQPAGEDAVEVVVIGASPNAPQKPKAATGATGNLKTAFALKISPANAPVLGSHVIKGRSVVPMAMAMEWMAHGAMHANPGLALAGLRDVRVARGILIHEGETRPLSVHTGKAVKSDGRFEIAVELRGGEDSEALHYTGTVVLAAQTPQAETSAVLTAGNLKPWDPARHWYGNGLLFHGPMLHVIESIDGVGEDGIAARLAPKCAPGDWFEKPLRAKWLTLPEALDALFQLVIVWSRDIKGEPCLPSYVGEYEQFATPAGTLGAVIRIEEVAGKAVRAVMELRGEDGGLVARIAGFEGTLDAKLESAFQQTTLAGR